MFEPAVHMPAHFASFTSQHTHTHTKNTSTMPRHSCWRNLRARARDGCEIFSTLHCQAAVVAALTFTLSISLFAHYLRTHTHSYIIFTTFPACNGGAHAPENESGNRCQGHKDNAAVVCVFLLSPSALCTHLCNGRQSHFDGTTLPT